MRADDPATLALHLVTRHGRATPLLWLSVDKDELNNQRNDFEDLCLTPLKALPPEGVSATILADRGFAGVKLFEFLKSLGFQHVIRIRGGRRNPVGCGLINLPTIVVIASSYQIRRAVSSHSSKTPESV